MAQEFGSLSESLWPALRCWSPRSRLVVVAQTSKRGQECLTGARLRNLIWRLRRWPRKKKTTILRCRRCSRRASIRMPRRNGMKTTQIPVLPQDLYWRRWGVTSLCSPWIHLPVWTWENKQTDVVWRRITQSCLCNIFITDC